MTAPQVLDSLQSRGVVLLADPSAPDGVRIRAPRGLLTDAQKARVRALAPKLRPLLRDSSGGENGVKTVSDSGQFSEFSAVPTRARARELEKVGKQSDLPSDHQAFPAWLAYAKATAGRVASFEEWRADRVAVELAELGRVVEDLLAVPEEAAHADAWADALDWLDGLEPIAWPRSHVFIPCVATWLRLAGERRNRFRRLYGPDWAIKSNVGKVLAQDLTELRRFLLSIPEEVRINTFENASKQGGLFD